MDLTSDIFNTILSPLAAFLPEVTPNTGTTPESHPDTDSSTPEPSSATGLTEWQTSPLNPQSRLDSLASIISAPGETPTAAGAAGWRLDGVDATGRRFFATPLFAINKPPLRIDVFLPPVEEFPSHLREVIMPQEAIYKRRSGKGGGVEDLDVGRWLLRVLWRWQREMESNMGCELEKMWWGVPFGSAITVDVGMSGGREEVALVARYGAEQGMVAVERLKEMWKGEADWEGVEVVEWERLRFERQLHEVISLVTAEGLGDGKRGVFKSVLQEQRYMYNELKMLLSLETHPSVVSRPIGVVTKKGRFGSRSGVCGFLLEWFPLGSLRDRLLRDDYERTTSMAQRMRWARQVTEALVHINRHPAGFYPDLKPDNIVFRENAETGRLDAVLIDLEQRGGWFAWSPPEVAYLEYLGILADDTGLPDGELKGEIVAQLRAYYADPDWLPGAGNQRYKNSDGGFSSPWLALLKQGQAGSEGRDLLERAQVFMLGKLLWCIFEGQAMVRCGIDHEILRDADPGYESARTGNARAFPEFRRTPGALRRLIRACTAGAPEWDTGQSRLPGVVLRGGKLYPATSSAILDSCSGEILAAAKRYWAREIDQARGYLRELLAFRGQPQEHEQERHSLGAGRVPKPVLLDQVRSRPLFSAILGELEHIEKCL